MQLILLKYILYIFSTMNLILASVEFGLGPLLHFVVFFQPNALSWCAIPLFVLTDLCCLNIQHQPGKTVLRVDGGMILDFLLPFSCQNIHDYSYPTAAIGPDGNSLTSKHHEKY